MRVGVKLPLLLVLATALVVATPASAGKNTRKISHTVRLDRAGATYDYGGATLVWTGRGDCSQRENMPPMFAITAPGVTLKNAIIVGAPDGIHIYSKGVVLENLTFPDVCEDAVTFKRGASKATIRDCRFAKAKDKVIQASHGRGHKIYRCHFENCARAFRSKAGVTAKFHQNHLKNCRTGVRADGKGSRTTMWNNRFENVRHPVQLFDGAKVLRFRPNARKARR